MLPEWREVRVGEICEVFDGPHATPDRTDSGPIFLGISSLKQGRIDLSQSDHISEEDFAEWTKRVTPESGDVVFSYETRLGEAGLVPPGLRCCLGRRMGLLRIRDRSLVDPLFLLYNYLSPAYQAVISERTVFGSTVERIPLKEVPDFPMVLPPISQQKSIANTLGTLDSKIELNRKINETLEDITKALFKSWFVDFDPVRAKAEGRSTGLPDEISELFPDSFEGSELGEIPSGWSTGSAGEHLELIKGRSYTSAELQESSTALVTLKSFKRGGGYREDGLKPYVGSFKQEQVIKPGELVIALTDVTQAADVIGRPAIVRTSDTRKTLVASLDVGIIRKSSHGLLPQAFAYELFRTENYVSHALSYTSGTTVLHLTKGVLADFRMVIPPIRLIEIFASFSASVLERIDISSQQSKTLEKLRDTLLPKLISGELRVPDAERMIEEVGI